MFLLISAVLNAAYLTFPVDSLFLSRSLLSSPLLLLLYLVYSLILCHILFSLPEKDRRVQTKGRGAIWPLEPQVDQVDAQTVLPLLFWTILPGPEPGIPVRGGGLIRGPKVTA